MLMSSFSTTVSVLWLHHILKTQKLQFFYKYEWIIVTIIAFTIASASNFVYDYGYSCYSIY